VTSILLFRDWSVAMTSKLKTGIVALLFSAAITPAAVACLWDSDTLQMERLRFPGVLEIITGKFVRHSRAYYEWRVKDRLKKLEAQPGDPALIDDLAVGYDKLERYDEGIAVLEKSLEAQPDRYETLANLATLLFHAGRIEESKQHVERALEINPDAHFGREKYQLLLTDYVLQSELAISGVLSSKERRPRVGGFARYVLEAQFGKDERLDYRLSGQDAWSSERREELSKARRGVLGMLHFADHKSPVLLEALGDLLIADDIDANASQLASRAYLRAAAGSKDPAIAEKYRTMARSALADHENFGMHHKEGSPDYLLKLDAQLAKEVASADAWYSAIEQHEQRWIASGADVDREFAKVYYKTDALDETIAAAESQVRSEPKDARLSNQEQDRMLVLRLGLLFIGLPTAILGVILVLAVWWYRRRSSARANSPAKPFPA
jgi:tetratricopeptide (TPR) repeat protein